MLHLILKIGIWLYPSVEIQVKGLGQDQITTQWLSLQSNPYKPAPKPTLRSTMEPPQPTPGRWQLQCEPQSPGQVDAFSSSTCQLRALSLLQHRYRHRASISYHMCICFQCSTQVHIFQNRKIYFKGELSSIKFTMNKAFLSLFLFPNLKKFNMTMRSVRFPAAPSTVFSWNGH